MAGDTAHHASVFIVYLALNNAMPEAAVVLRRRYGTAEFLVRTKATRTHAKGRKDLTLAERVQWFTGDLLDQIAENDEADVGILRSCPWVSRQRLAKAGVDHRKAIVCRLEETDVTGETGGVIQQHPQRDSRPPGVGMLRRGKLWQPVLHRRVESKQPAIVKTHDGSCRCQYLSQAG